MVNTPFCKAHFRLMREVYHDKQALAYALDVFANGVTSKNASIKNAPFVSPIFQLFDQHETLSAIILLALARDRKVNSYKFHLAVFNIGLQLARQCSRISSPDLRQYLWNVCLVRFAAALKTIGGTARPLIDMPEANWDKVWFSNSPPDLLKYLGSWTLIAHAGYSAIENRYTEVEEKKSPFKVPVSAFKVPVSPNQKVWSTPMRQKRKQNPVTPLSEIRTPPGTPRNSKAFVEI
jgi:hypothetical protein